MTAVTWLLEELDNKDWYYLPQSIRNEIINQAKELEKKQIMQAVYDSMGTNFDPNMGRAELYYNEKFKSE